MRALDKIFQIILGVVLFFISAAALVFLDFSTEHGLIYPEVLYCIPASIVILLFVVFTIVKHVEVRNGSFRIVGIVWDILFSILFFSTLGTPEIVFTNGWYGIICKVLFICILLLPKAWIFLSFGD